jgi:RHS repeat-associated protein
MLNDVASNPIYGWDSRGHVIETRYDELRRPTEILVQGIEGFPANHKVLIEEIIYGESQGSTNNHRGRIYQQRDAAGIITNVEFDYKGNPVESSRQITKQYRNHVDWSAPPVLTETFASHTSYDALNRPIQLIAPHSDQTETKINIIQPLYNEANLLEQVHVWLNQDSAPADWLNPETANLHPVANIDYDAKGQRTFIEYGNGTRTGYEYDPETFRLTHLLTKRNAATFPHDCPSPPLTDWPGCEIQSLYYTYDPVGNITGIRDDAQQTIFFRNRRVEPNAEYTYDALYRLIKATGREHLGQTGGGLNPPCQTNHDELFRTNLLHPGDGNAMGNYTENYEYDAVGNILSLIHQAASGGWTRHYAYEEPSLIEPDKKSNRLSSTSLPGDDPEGPYSAPYSHDEHGNMTSMPHLTLMQWDYKDQLRSTSRQKVNDPDCTAETTYYVYDASGQRVRKVIECYAAAGQTARRSHERIYLGGFEIYREYNGDGVTVITERETLHIMDDQQRIALVETKTVEDGSEVLKPKAIVRYQLNNHLGSSSLELDGDGVEISYEEYYPYGSTSYQAVAKEIKAVAKRYRYTGKERDDETGLYYYGARYYAAWLGRWVSCDPMGCVEGNNLFIAMQNSPINFKDSNGLQASAINEKLLSEIKMEPRITGNEIKKRLPNIDYKSEPELGINSSGLLRSLPEIKIEMKEMISNVKEDLKVWITLERIIGQKLEKSNCPKEICTAENVRALFRIIRWGDRSEMQQLQNIPIEKQDKPKSHIRGRYFASPKEANNFPELKLFQFSGSEGTANIGLNRTDILQKSKFAIYGTVLHEYQHFRDDFTRSLSKTILYAIFTDIEEKKVTHTLRTEINAGLKELAYYYDVLNALKSIEKKKGSQIAPVEVFENIRRYLKRP